MKYMPCDCKICEINRFLQNEINAPDEFVEEYGNEGLILEGQMIEAHEKYTQHYSEHSVKKAYEKWKVEKNE